MTRVIEQSAELLRRRGECVAKNTTNRTTTSPQLAIDVKHHPKKIEEVYVAVADLENGEGIYSILGPEGQTLPVVAVDPKDLELLSEYAREQVKKTGRTVSIIGFTKRTHHETFRPPTTGDKK
jgi:hypothetical protein